jgi:hypothetical protein
VVPLSFGSASASLPATACAARLWRLAPSSVTLPFVITRLHSQPSHAICRSLDRAWPARWNAHRRCMPSTIALPATSSFLDLRPSSPTDPFVSAGRSRRSYTSPSPDRGRARDVISLS